MPTTAETIDDILGLIAKFRDAHAMQASDWQRLLESYAQTGNAEQVSHASGMIERNNFAVTTLGRLLIEAEARNRRTAVCYAGGEPR